MSSQRDYLIIGDSNVRHFYLKLGLQAQNLDFVQARNLSETDVALGSIKTAYKFVVFAFLTNLIVAAGEEGSNPVDRLSAIEDLFNSITQMLS